MSDKKQNVKVVTLVVCEDIATKARYEVGTELELSQERADAAVAAGFVELAVPKV